MSGRLILSLTLFSFSFFCFPTIVFSQGGFVPLPESGRELFTKQWKPNDIYNETGPDGLGPMFNADSCVACHNLGGVGGAGDNSTNVQLMSLLPRQKVDRTFRTDEQALRSMFENGGNLHPDFAKSNSTVLHRSSTNETAFADWQHETLQFRRLKNVKQNQVAEKLLAERTRLLSEDPIYRVKKESARKRYTVQVTRRNTPALFGVNAIESIPDDVIRAIALKQKKQVGPIKGIVPELPNNQVGKFGWRGDKASVREFTVQACAVELGLSNSQHDQAALPFKLETPHVVALEVLVVNDPDVRASSFLVQIFNSLSGRIFETPNQANDEFDSPFPSENPNEREPKKKREHDMTDLQVESMISFVKSLPAPIPLTADSDSELESVQIGRERFNAIGCGDCHVRHVDSARNVFSDFLLHDMGEELADAAGVVRFVGNGTQIEIDNDRLWQTPPLWGVALSAPYLHDGRARDLESAITKHGGEAFETVQEFQKLEQEEKEQLLKFLESLGDGASQKKRGGPVVIASGGWSSPQPPPQGMLVRRRR